MADDPGFLFYPGDYLRDTQNLSEKTQVAYDRIMCEHMRNICITQSQLKFFTKRLSPEEIDELKMVLVKNSKGFCIKWVAESIEKRRNYSESRRKNRKGKNDLSDKNNQIISESYVPHMDNENEIENEDESNKERYEVYKNQCLTHMRWQNDLCIACKIEMASIPEIINQYIAHLGSGAVAHGTLKDFKQHLRNWLLSKPNGNNSNNNTPKLLMKI